ncbi:MAG: ThiF family adenylyltransferase [Candidatus Bipolaricaulaceae bacterium]
MTAEERIVAFYGQENFRRRRNTTVLLVGIGAIGSKVGAALAKGGYDLVAVDYDAVEPPNLPFQEYEAADVGRPKAEAFAERAAALSPFPIKVTPIPLSFSEAVEVGAIPECQLVVAVPDNDLARLEVASYFLEKSPVVVAGISEDGHHGYVFVQEVGQACLKCAFPTIRPRMGVSRGCGAYTAEMAHILTGYVLFAVDSLVVDHPLRRRSWNLCKVYLNSSPDVRTRIQKRENCELCSREKG